MVGRRTGATRGHRTSPPIHHRFDIGAAENNLEPQVHTDKKGFFALSVCICVHLWFHCPVWLELSPSAALREFRIKSRPYAPTFTRGPGSELQQQALTYFL